MAKRTLDFSNVKEQGDFAPRHVEEGDYTATVTKFMETTKKDDSSKAMWVFTIVLEDKPSGRYPYYCTLNEEALWKIRNLLVAGGFKVPKKRMAVDPEKIVGRKIGVHMVDDEYNGQMKSVIDAVFPVSEAEGDDDPKSKGRAAEDDDDEDEEEEEEPPAKPAKKKRKPEPEPEPEDDEEDEDEEDEEEPPPPPKKSKKAAKKPPPPADDEDDDDDLEVDDDDL